MMNKSLLSVVIGLGLVGCGNAPVDQENTTPANDISAEETVKMGVIFPLSGEASSYGLAIQPVVDLTVKQINETGGINGKNLEVIFEDGKCAPGDASKSAQKLVNVDKVNVILGGFCSGETLAAAPITEKKKVILLSPSSSNPDISQAGDFVYRTAPSDIFQGRVLGKLLTEKFAKVGILTEQTDYSLGILGAIKENFSGEIVEETYLPTESDFKTRITKFKNSELDAVVLIPQTPAKLEIIIKQLEEQKWDKPLVGAEMLIASPDILEKSGDYLSTLDVWSANFVEPNNVAFDKLAADYLALTGKEVEYANYAATSADAINILANAMKSVENPGDTVAIKNYLNTMEPFTGINTDLTFDENGDIKNLEHSLFKLVDGTFVKQ